MQDSSLPSAEETIATPIPNPAIERPWIVKIAVFMLIGSMISSLLQLCAGVANLTLFPPLALVLPVYAGLQGFTAWGLWQMRDLARKGLIAIVIVNAIGFVYKTALVANYGPTLAFFAIIVGLILRGAFIRWFLVNEQLFVE